MDKVGFVGLGIMGTSMARNLIEDGHELVIHNRTRAKAEKLAKLGAEVAQELSRTANTRGVGMLDAPVSGGDIGAIEGTLSIMVGGEKEDFERARPLFEAMGKTIVHVGAAGAGQTVKACNQIVVALVIEAVSEALVWTNTAKISATATSASSSAAIRRLLL